MSETLPSRAKKIIKRLRIREISIVDDPACPGADVMISKRRGGEIGDEIADLREDFQKASALAALTGGKDMDELEKRLKEIEEKQAELEAEVTTHKARADKAEQERDAALAEVEKAKKSAGDQSGDEDIFKGLPPALKARFETVEKRATQAEAKIAEQAEQRAEDEAVAKAKTYGLGDAEAIGKLMVRISKGKTTADDVGKVEELLKSAAKLAEAGTKLFERMGGGGGDADDPELVLKGKVEELRKAKPDLTNEQAVDEVMEANPALYDAVVAKQRRDRAARI